MAEVSAKGPPAYVVAGAYGLSAAFFYALQHPFQKPFVKAFSHDLTGALNIGVYAEAVLIAFFVLAWSVSANVKNALRYMWSAQDIKLPINRWTFRTSRITATLLLSCMAVISGPLYSFSLQHMNAVFLSLILNLFPVYNLFVNAFVENKRPPAYGVILALGGFAVVAGTQWAIEPIAVGDIIPFVGNFVLVSLVPVLFGLRAILFSKWFGSHIKTIPRVIVIASFDAPIFIGVMAAILFATGGQLELPSEGLLRWSLFIAAVMSSGIAGAVFFQLAYKWSASEQGWYPGLFFFLVPFMVMVVGWLLALWQPGLDDTKFDWRYLPGVFIIGMIIVIVATRIRKEIHERRIVESGGS